jgi:hypothetical protein
MDSCGAVAATVPEPKTGDQESLLRHGTQRKLYSAADLSLAGGFQLDAAFDGAVFDC